MTVTGKRWLVWGTLLVLLLAGLTAAFWPRPLVVETLVVVPAPMQAVLETEGTARVRDVFTVSAPVAGRMRRNLLEAGDYLKAGASVVATLEPVDAAFLDPRAAAESEADLAAAVAELHRAEAERDRVEADRAFAARELARIETLFTAGTVPQRTLDEARHALAAAAAQSGAAEAAVDVRERQVLRARARLIAPAARLATDGVAGEDTECACITLRAPVDGRVLRVLVRSETVVPAGTPLIEIGDPADLEIVADFLSTDAVRIAPGQAAEIVGWGGSEALAARVRRVEPFGFTRVSALGIEEQRVNVVFDLETPRSVWSSLGHGYRVTARVIEWSEPAALAVPVTALFRGGAGDWQVFVVDAGRARLRTVVPDHRSGMRVEIRTGLAAGDVVVANPPEVLAAGMAVAVTPG